ncbi:MAG: HD domain-containing protein [Phycisphaerales bacterium]|nr:HD domain-containing protein [Phycisphaerales bacterium]
MSNPHDSSPLESVPRDEHELLLVGGGYTATIALRELLAAAGGITITYCSRANDAVDEAMRTCPTVILLDLREPGFDPIATLNSLARSPEVGAVPVIVVVSAATCAIREAAFVHGATDFIVYPVSTAELVARVRGHSMGYLNVVRRNRSTAAYESLQCELRSAHRALEQHKLQLAKQSDAPSDLEWQLRVRGLLQVGIELNQIQDFHTLMDRILSEARNLVRTEAGTVFLREGDFLRFAFFHNQAIAQRTGTGDTPQVSAFRLPITDRSLAGWVCLTGQHLHIPDCYQIAIGNPYRFDSSFDQVLGYRTRAMLAVPLKSQAGHVLGVMELINPLSIDGLQSTTFSESDIRLVEHFASVAAVAIERARLTESTVLRMIRMAELRDPAETGRHVERVAGYSALIFEEWARRRGLEGPAFERQRDRLRTAAKLHDVGKIGVSDLILKKVGKLEPHEFEEIKRHAQIGADLFGDSPSDFDDAAREVALLHHERWNGQGYPGIEEDGTRRGRRGEETPLFARIVGLADVFDALGSPRSYKEAWPEHRVLELIQAESAGHFDPELVDILFARLDEIRSVRDGNPDLPPNVRA